MKRQPIGSCVVVYNEGITRILLGKRQNSYKAGFYGIPGGRIEPSELAGETAIRELAEETGLKAKTLEFVGVVKEWQGEWFFIHFGYVCFEYEGEVKTLEDKCEQWEWYEKDKLPNLILPGHKAIIEMTRNHQIFMELG